MTHACRRPLVLLCGLMLSSCVPPDFNVQFDPNHVLFRGETFTTTVVASGGSAPYVYTIETSPSHGVATFINGGPDLEYESTDLGFSGDDSFLIRVNDSAGGTSNGRLVSVEVLPTSCAGQGASARSTAKRGFWFAKRPARGPCPVSTTS